MIGAARNADSPERRSTQLSDGDLRALDSAMKRLGMQDKTEGMSRLIVSAYFTACPLMLFGSFPLVQHHVSQFEFMHALDWRTTHRASHR